MSDDQSDQKNQNTAVTVISENPNGTHSVTTVQTDRRLANLTNMGKGRVKGSKNKVHKNELAEAIAEVEREIRAMVDPKDPKKKLDPKFSYLKAIVKQSLTDSALANGILKKMYPDKIEQKNENTEVLTIIEASHISHNGNKPDVASESQ